MIKFNENEIKVLKIASEYRWKVPTPSQIAYITGETPSRVSSLFFRMRERHKVKSNDELIKMFKERMR